MTSIAGLASGQGRNLKHIHEREPGGATLGVILSDDPEAAILEWASDRGIDSLSVERPPEMDRAEHERRLLQSLEEFDVDLIALDGFRPGLGETFLDHAPLTIDVHPSLLPAFPGQNPHKQALEAGVAVTGCTLHVLQNGQVGAAGSEPSATDAGPIITQEPVPVYDDDTPESLQERVTTEAGFTAYPRVIRWFANDDLTVTDDGVSIADDDAGPFPFRRFVSEDRRETLRYGENPHQKAALYQDQTVTGPSVVQAEQLHEGAKAMSYNNYNDAAAALGLIEEFAEPAAAVIKHTNPAGCAVASSLAEAYDRALATDAKSAFGGIVALNRTCEAKTADRIVDSFKEAVVAPTFTDDALAVLEETDNLRVIPVGDLEDRADNLVEKQLAGGRLVQEPDRFAPDPDDLEVVTERAPTQAERETMAFAWRTIKHVKSNAIVFATGTETVGIGMGQVSRVDAVRLAAMKAERDAAGKDAAGAVMASDAFFPFRDGIDEAAEAGIEAVVQPGGSVNDEDVIEAADEHDMAMAFTGHRCFRHD